MVMDVALETRTARAIVRRSGYRPPVAEAGPSAATRTVVDGIVSPYEEPNARVWLVDLAGASELRFSCEANVSMYLNRSTATNPEGIDGPWTALTLDDGGTPTQVAASRSDTVAGDLRWFSVPEELQEEHRLCVGHSASEASLDPSRLDGPFSVAVQVR